LAFEERREAEAALGGPELREEVAAYIWLLQHTPISEDEAMAAIGVVLCPKEG